MSKSLALSAVEGTISPLFLIVNGRGETHKVSREATLLHFLRNTLELNGPKYGCGLGQCGACTVWVDGVAARACVIPAHGVGGRAITTLEGLGSRQAWHPVQAAFEHAQAAQCGYCLNGMVMQAAALLAREPHPSEARIRAELSGNLCRCGTHVEIMQAVQLAAARMGGMGASGDAEPIGGELAQESVDRPSAPLPIAAHEAVRQPSAPERDETAPAFFRGDPAP